MRLEGFKNPYDLCNGADQCEIDAWERCADAMAEALREQSMVTVPGDYPSVMVNFPVTPHASGVLVFIPDDQ